MTFGRVRPEKYKLSNIHLILIDWMGANFIRIKITKMLYLLEDRDYLKIGYTTNLNERMKSYKTCNCYIKLIASKPGSKKDEHRLHKLCEN